MNFQTPISHHKLSNSAQQNKNQQLVNQHMLQSGNEKSSSKNSLSQQLQIFQQPALQQIQQYQNFQSSSQSQPQISNSPKIETPFFTTNLKSSQNTNIFAQSQPNQSQTMRKENIFQNSQSLQQDEPIQYKFGGSYQIFESMIGKEIKDLEQIFTQNDYAYCEDQRAEAFAGCIDIQRLQEVMEEGQASDYEVYVDNQFQNNYLQISVPNDLFDEETAIKKSLSILNQEYINLDKFQYQDDNCEDLGAEFFEQ